MDRLPESKTDLAIDLETLMSSSANTTRRSSLLIPNVLAVLVTGPDHGSSGVAHLEHALDRHERKRLHDPAGARAPDGEARAAQQHRLLRLVLALCAKHKMIMRSVNISYAFLHGDLQESVYMRQPECFEQGGADYVCKLNKAVYGFK